MLPSPIAGLLFDIAESDTRLDEVESRIKSHYLKATFRVKTLKSLAEGRGNGGVLL